jgi:GSH-dependent disulfide-bond oxidoreductase
MVVFCSLDDRTIFFKNQNNRSKKMIELYTANTPNGQKPSIMLAEIGLPYQICPVNIAQGEQHTDAFLAINPNGKIPAIVDRSVEGGQRVFESGAILIYLAEKVGKLLPTDGKNRSEVLAWTFWQVGGLGPMIGQWGHFTRSAPEKLPYAINRYLDESVRLLNVLNGHLIDRTFIADDYSIADIMNYTWASSGLNFIRSAHPDRVENLAALDRWVKVVGDRPAVKKGLEVLK